MRSSPTFPTFLSLFAVFLSIIPAPGLSANILFYHNIASYSHRVPTYELALALAKRGHQVTMISPFQPREPIEKHKNLTDITPALLAKTITDWLQADLDINLRVKKLLPRNVFNVFPTAVKGCEDLLRSAELQEYFDKTHSLDLVFLDHCLSECGAAIAHKYGAKFIYFSTVTRLPYEHDFLGTNPPESGVIPELEIEPPTTPMTFWERAFNVLISIHFRYEHYKYMTQLDGIVRRHLKLTKEMPFLDDLARNHSLIFSTGDVITDFPRSDPPNVINVAGIHCKNMSGGMTSVVEQFIMDEDSEEFVYISLGSFVKPHLLPDHIKAALFSSIQSFPKVKFLWKWNGEVPQNYPRNLLFAPWFPQQEILGHSKILGFVTQSGRPSTLEAVYHGVPMVCFPVIGDQDIVADRMVTAGSALKLELGTVKEEEFTNALSAIVHDDRMMSRAKELQRIFQDRAQTPLETALWWTEYVLRNEDVSHLKPAGLGQTWYERRLLDVYLILFVVILSVLSVLLITSATLVRAFLRMALNGRDNKVKGE